MNQATMTYLPLAKGYVEVSMIRNTIMFRSPVMLVPHEAAQRRRKAFSNSLRTLQKDQIYIGIQRTGQKVWSKEVVSKNADPNSDHKEFNAALLSGLREDFLS
ncbi:hypothetical protein TNCV_3439081 [Trichonephila clavipes]|nr:hypothetical protein TNCV_3439081 [Trichonephila clavipes]